MRHGNLAELPLPDGVRRRRGQLPGDRTPVGSGAVRRRMPAGAAARRGAADVDPQPHHLLPRPRHPHQPVPHPRTQRRRADRAAGVGAGFTLEAMLGVFHGRAARRARRHATAARSSMPRSPVRWPTRRGPPTCSPTSRRSTSTTSICARATATSTTAWIWSRSRCGRDGAHAEPVPGLFTLVLHTHLPWLAHHGRWPVGEEWLYQSWSAAYLPLVRVLRTLAAEDRRHLVTLGITPVVAAQLDDPYCLTGMHHWLANWQLRALEATTLQEPLREFGIREHAEADRELDEFDRRCGGTAPARCCANCSTPTSSSCSAGRWRTRSSRC